MNWWPFAKETATVELDVPHALLADIEKRGIKTIYCLGDVVGYGPNPCECLDLIIEKSEWCVLGNHDYAVFYEPTNFNYGAEQASFWTREVLEMDGQGAQSDRRWQFLGELPMRRSVKTQLGPAKATIDFVHASPRGVLVSRLDAETWRVSFKGARRYLP